MGRRVLLRVYTEIGRFGAGLELGYRWLDIDCAKGDGNGRFAYDVLTRGPVVGFGSRFDRGLIAEKVCRR